MSRFIENEASPIVSTLLRQGFIPDYSEALSLIDQSETRTRGDAMLALGATGLGVASTCGILALSGVTAPILIPIGAALGCLATAWNSRQTEIDRIKESEFLGQFPQVLTLIESKDSAGATEEHIAAAYEQTFKSYRYGELDDIERFIGGTKATKLQDIPIDDSPIADPVATVPTVIQPPPVAPAPPVAGLPGFIAEMTYPVRSGMIVGLPGAGKDLVMANVLGRIADRNPEMQIFLTDPKNSPKESGYFQRFNSANVDRFKAKGMSAFEIQERMEAMYSKVVNAGEKTLWAINEFATLVGLVDDKWLKGFNAKLQTIVQMGDSEENYLWIVSQTGNLSELKLPSSLRGTLARNFLAIAQPGYEAALAGLTRTDLITNHDDARMRVMWDRSPVKRAYFYSTLNRWEMMPVLTNLSGYDRDARRWVPGFVPVEPPSEATVFDVAAVDRALGVSAFTSNDVQPSAGEGDIKAELVRYLSGVSEPKRVSQIRTSIKPPHRGIGSDKLRLLLAELVKTNQIQVVDSRFTASN
jgi:hypothetical protein